MTKEVAIIQSESFISRELQNTYLDSTAILTSKSIKVIYKFITTNALKKCIFKFILDIDSNVLDKLIDYISCKKELKSKSVSILKKCTFMATRSNATSVRKKKNLRDMKLYFTLTSLDEILKDYNDNTLFIVSNENTPYYNEVYHFKHINNYRVLNITLDVLNKYKGSSITCVLNTKDEYQHVVNLILQSKYKGTVQFFEVYFTEIIGLLRNSMNSVSAGTCISGNYLDYPELKYYNTYENTSLMLACNTSLWSLLIKNKLVSKNVCDYGIAISIIK